MTGGATEELRRRVAAVLPGPVTPLEVLPGGHSGLTYRLTASGRPLVVKAVPPGRKAIGRHDVLRQARILRALTPTAVPVPGFVVADEANPAWFAMEWVPGQAVEPVLDVVELPPGLARARALEATRVLARLHGVAPSSAGEEPALSLRDELAKWDAVLHAGPAEFIPAGERLLAALAARIPEPRPVTLVHGDYRLGNILFDGDQARALVDWEIWSVGDPPVHLGYFGAFTD